MHEDTAEHDETDNGPDEGNGALFVEWEVGGRVGERQGSVRFELCSCLEGEEESADAHGTKVAYEEGFFGGVYGGEERGFVQGEDNGDAAEEEDGRKEGEEAQGCDGVQCMEGFPGNHCAKKDEEGRVEHKVDDDGKGRVFRGGIASVAEAAAGAESDEEVVDTDGGGKSDAEYGGEEVECEVGRWADHLALVGEAVEPVECMTEDDAENNADDTLVQDSDEEPFLEDASSGNSGQKPEAHEEKGKRDAVVAAAFCAE